MKFRELLKDGEIWSAPRISTWRSRTSRAIPAQWKKAMCLPPLVGEVADGHNYIGAAVEKGACAWSASCGRRRTCPSAGPGQPPGHGYLSRSYFGIPPPG
jgi:hypothetical protein